MSCESPIYCAVCGNQGDRSSSSPSKLSSGKPISIFQCFLKLFHAKWHGKTFPFCEECRSQIALISQLQEDLQELEKKLKQTQNQLESKLEGSEARFKERRLYQKDERYFKLRKKILGDKVQAQWSDGVENESEEEEDDQCFEVEYIMVEVEEPLEKIGGITGSPQPPDTPDENQDNLEQDWDGAVASGKVGEIVDQEEEEEDKGTPPAPPVAKVSRPQRKQKKKKRRSLLLSPESGSDEDDDDEEDEEFIPDEDDDQEDFVKGDRKLSAHEEKQWLAKKTIYFHKVRLDALAGGRYKCSQCPSILPNRRNLIRAHVVKEHTLLHACPHCLRRFDRDSRLQQHIKCTHDKVTPKAQCPICARPFFRLDGITSHVWTHYSQQDKAEAIERGEKIPFNHNKEFHCSNEMCARVFKSSAALANHMSRQHGHGNVEVDKQKQLCGICGAAVTDLRPHMAIKHTSPHEKPFECGICKKRFAYNNHLTKHRKAKHETEKPWKCEICWRAFKFERNMKEHQLGHQKVKPFECNLCGMGFTRRPVLTRHIANIHEGKPRKDRKKPKKKRIKLEISD